MGPGVVVGEGAAVRRWLVAALSLAAVAGAQPAAAAEAGRPGYVYSRQYITDRFGDSLRADVYLPAGADGNVARGRFPVILAYDFGDEIQRDTKTAAGQPSLTGPPLAYVQNGYVFAVVGQPGTGGSSGPQGIYDKRAELAGVDAVQWLGRRPWSTGKVGMYGQSGPGIAQPLVAQHRPSHLKTIVPVVATTHWFSDVLCRGGMATSWERLILLTIVLTAYNGTNGLVVPAGNDDIGQFQQMWNQKLLNGWLPPSPQWFPRPDAGDPSAAPQAWADLMHGCGAHTQAVSGNAHVGRITVPIWSFGSYNDFFELGNLDLFTSATRAPARRLTMDLIGHAQPAHGYDFTRQTLRWYDRWLKGIRNGVDKEPPVDYFTIEENAWHHARDWPPPAARRTRMYIDAGDGDPLGGRGLSATRPRVKAASDTYTYNPGSGANDGTFGIAATHADDSTMLPGVPVGNDNPITRNLLTGPGDQRAAADALVYLGEPLKADTEVTGPVKATLYASSTASDTDWVVKLIDVFPDGATASATGPQPGYWALATTGWRSGTRRNSLTDPEPIPVGEVVKYDVDLQPTSYEFKAGHRIGVVISSADASRTYPNPNPATNTVRRDARHPTHIDLPVSVAARAR